MTLEQVYSAIWALPIHAPLQLFTVSSQNETSLLVWNGSRERLTIYVNGDNWEAGSTLICTKYYSHVQRINLMYTIKNHSTTDQSTGTKLPSHRLHQHENLNICFDILQSFTVLSSALFCYNLFSSRDSSPPSSPSAVAASSFWFLPQTLAHSFFSGCRNFRADDAIQRRAKSFSKLATFSIS